VVGGALKSAPVTHAPLTFISVQTSTTTDHLGPIAITATTGIARADWHEN
jgi:hypothetical protein